MRDDVGDEHHPLSKPSPSPKHHSTMIVLEGVPLTPGAALDPLDPHFKPNPDRATPILDRPLLVPLDTPHVPSHLKASTSTSQLASSSHSDPAPYTLRLITYGFERGRPDITPALTFDIRDLPNPPKPVRRSPAVL